MRGHEPPINGKGKRMKLIMVDREFASVSMMVNEELSRAEEKFPEWPDDIIHAAAIVAEESGEIIQAALQAHYDKGRVDKVKKEAIHTAAMCYRLITAIERKSFETQKTKDV